VFSVVVPLRWTASDCSSVRLGELTGDAELSVTSTDLDGALALVDALMQSTPRVLAHELATPDRDRVMAALLEHVTGPIVESTVSCRSCGEPFELSFTLADLVRHRSGEQGDAVIAVNRGAWSIDGIGFRFPTGADERTARLEPDPAAVLRRRCVDLHDPSDRQLDAVESAMSQLAPILTTSIAGDCPECEHRHAVEFDVQRYTLALIQLGRERVLRDVHIIASAYGWTRADILGLRRSERRSYVDLINTRQRSPVST